MPRDGLHQANGTRLIATNKQCIEMTKNMKQIFVLLGLIESPPKSKTLVAHDENLLVILKTHKLPCVNGSRNIIFDRYTMVIFSNKHEM